VTVAIVFVVVGIPAMIVVSQIAGVVITVIGLFAHLDGGRTGRDRRRGDRFRRLTRGGARTAGAERRRWE